MTNDQLPLLYTWRERNKALGEHLRQHAQNGRSLQILEAGCGEHWGLDLTGVSYTLTGVDNDPAALDHRKHTVGDLDIAIVGDLRTVTLDAGAYDAIYCSYVLEHIDGAADVLAHFLNWLKPGGLLLMAFPDRNSAYGFLTRLTPFWLHILYKRYVQGLPDAGKPGHAPYPTFYDRVLTRDGMQNFCRQHSVSITAEYGVSGYLSTLGRVYRLPVGLLMWGLHILSAGKLAARHTDLVYVIKNA